MIHQIIRRKGESTLKQKFPDTEKIQEEQHMRNSERVMCIKFSKRTADFKIKSCCCYRVCPHREMEQINCTEISYCLLK